MASPPSCPFTITPRVESISDVKACEYATLADQLGLTDFNPLTVDWEKPVPWGNNASICNMDTSDGCLMPLGAGFGIVLGQCTVGRPIIGIRPSRRTVVECIAFRD